MFIFGLRVTFIVPSKKPKRTLIDWLGIATALSLNGFFYLYHFYLLLSRDLVYSNDRKNGLSQQYLYNFATTLGFIGLLCSYHVYMKTDSWDTFYSIFDLEEFKKSHKIVVVLGLLILNELSLVYVFYVSFQVVHTQNSFIWACIIFSITPNVDYFHGSNKAVFISLTVLQIKNILTKAAISVRRSDFYSTRAAFCKANQAVEVIKELFGVQLLFMHLKWTVSVIAFFMFSVVLGGSQAGLLQILTVPQIIIIIGTSVFHILVSTTSHVDQKVECNYFCGYLKTGINTRWFSCR